MLQRLTVTAAGVCVLTLVLHAAVPTFWQVSNEADFLRGELENLTVDAYGRLTLGPSVSAVYESTAPFLWTLVAAPDGSTYVGSGNEGQVFRVDPAGKGTLFFDAEELEVHAIALPPEGAGIYAATSPDGKVYRVDSAGKGSVFFDPPDRYIWSLAVDRGGNLFVAAGDRGVIYKVTPDGKGAPLYDTKATHAVSLAFDREGRLLAGTESPGRVLRIDAAGKPFVLLDSPYNEIHALRVDGNGAIHAVALSGRPSTGPAPAPRTDPDPAPQPSVSVSTEITAIAVVGDTQATTTTAQPPRANQGPATGAVYRILPEGGWDVLWESREDTPYDVAVEPSGSLLLSTGSRGKIFRLSGDPMQPTLIARANAQQVTALLPDRMGRVLIATSNPGSLFRLSPARAERGTYTSDVRDAQTVATWGTIRWQAQVPPGTRVDIATRSGNTRAPDETWSDWTPAYQTPEGSSIASPRARYLQWRAVLTATGADTPMLTSVSAAYLPRNARPRVTSITIHPPGTVFQRPFPTEPEIAGFDGNTPERRATLAVSTPPGAAPTLGRRTYEKGLLTFVWRAEDENRDELTYDVEYRREGESGWRPLKGGLTDSILVWDTTSVPDGRYLVRVIASDALSNAAATKLSGMMESTTFEIDNGPPAITVAGVRREGSRTTLTFEVRDDQSAVQKTEYSVDGNRWQVVYPKDGISDSRVEQFEVVVEGDASLRGIVVRAADSLNNVTSTRAEVPPAASSGRR